jgi:hypothetical protein
VSEIDRLLDAFRVPFAYVDEAGAQEALLAAERAFVEGGDLLVALHGVTVALEHGQPVPRRIAAWLNAAFGLYLHGRRNSLDEALGLKAAGRASPRRKEEESRTQKAALSQMLHLQSLGATIPEAALLVGRLSPDLKATTLEDRYRRSGYSQTAKEIKRALAHNHQDLDSALSQYPDTPLEARQAKERIRAMYAKSKASRT